MKTDSSKFTLPPDITIRATAWDEDGVMSGVEFFQGAGCRVQGAGFTK
ncbi:MAG: hypothetical protein JXR52_06270 [Bacteroidales bacterium]|nr:hypothetical protein [Bacteroidales bacterium]